MTLRYSYVMYIATTTEQLWKALTDPGFTREYWFGRAVESTWRVGAPVTITTPAGRVEMAGEVIACDPTNLLAYTWHGPRESGDAEEARRPSRVTFAIEPYGAAVRLTLLHEDLIEEDFGSAANAFRGVDGGWPAIMSSLKTKLETGHALLKFEEPTTSP